MLFRFGLPLLTAALLGTALVGCTGNDQAVPAAPSGAEASAQLDIEECESFSSIAEDQARSNKWQRASETVDGIKCTKIRDETYYFIAKYLQREALATGHSFYFEYSADMLDRIESAEIAEDGWRGHQRRYRKFQEKYY